MASFFEKLKGTKQEVSVEEESVEEKPIIEKPKARIKKAEKLKPNNQEKKELFEAEGQLAIDLYQTDSEVIIQAPIAGVKKEDLDIMIENDVIVIKGRREEPEETEEKNYFYQECYWGPFSRQVIMPVEGDPSRAEATMKNGILTIRIPRIEREKKRKLEIKE
jgi:HSP20 family protein